MGSPVEAAVATYIRAAHERDPAARAALLAACFADDLRFVMRSRVVGRAGVEAMLSALHADPELRALRVTHLDAAGTTFRMRSVVEKRDGSTTEFTDVGELDAAGKIATVMVFAGPSPIYAQPDNTAVRTALWRALHLEIDAPPHVLVDDLALALADPEPGWRDRGDMHPMGTRPFRASIVARARFVEDLVGERAPEQYVILGAGLDTFAQRRRGEGGPRVFEIDQPAPQAWKRARLAALGLAAPELVPVDFEAGEAWLDRLAAAGFRRDRPTVVAATGVSMYLTREANARLLREVASIPGVTLASSFILPMDLAGDEVKPGLATSAAGARAAGTPFESFFAPEDYVAMARAAGFTQVVHVSADDLAARYFAHRSDGLRPPARGEELVVATVT